MWINEAGDALARQRKLSVCLSVCAEAVLQYLSTPKLKSRFHSDFSQDPSWFCWIHQRPAWVQPWKTERKKLLHKERGKNVPVSFSLVWSLICRLWFKLRIKSPWGPEPTCSPYPFVQTGTKDNRKRLKPGVPWDPNLASSFLFLFFFIPSLPLTFCTSLSSHISSLWLFSFPFPPLNLCLPPIPHCKGIFCTALMERLLSNKGARTVERRQQIGSFVGSLKRLFHRGQTEREKGWARRRVWVRFIVTPSFQRKVRCVFNRA